MIRLLALSMIVLALSVYAWRDWYKSLCGLILLIAVVEHPDMPKTMLGMQGLNPWNFLLAVLLVAWLVQRRREGLVWDMPPHITGLLLVYVGVVLVGFFRMMGDRSGLENQTTAYLVSEYLVNTIKWVIPGLLLFDGCRSRARLTLALASLLGVYFLLALQVTRWMPPEFAFSGDSLSARSLKILVNEVGYHRVNLAMMLAGASWAIVAVHPLAERWTQACFVLGSMLVTTYALALTAGRMGYVTWAVVGTLLSLVRWRKYLVLIPFAVALVLGVAPGAVERLAQGLDKDAPDVYVVTAGRNIAWPLVVGKIDEAPLLGFGRRAMERTGIAAFLWDEYEEDFAHPHNAYLEMLLDNGWVGLLLILSFYGVVLFQAFVLFRDRKDPVFTTIGGVAAALVLALLVGALGSQTFYPREGAVPMWCAIGLLFRVAVERARGTWPGVILPSPSRGSGDVDLDHRVAAVTGPDWWRRGA